MRSYPPARSRSAIRPRSSTRNSRRRSTNLPRSSSGQRSPSWIEGHDRSLQNLDGALNMKLYVTYGSPYARLARIIVIEKAIEDRVEIIEAKTRTPDSPYYQINPSGRVPYLIETTPGSAWKTASSSAPISTVSTVSRVFTMHRTDPIGRIDGLSSRRAACATASPYGVAKWPGPRTSVRQPLLPISQRALGARVATQ